MKIVSYNIHYAIGKDERYDLERVIDAVRGADLIALQEVERYYDHAQAPQQPEDIAALLADYYWVYDAAFDVDCSETLADGRIVNRRRQHGQMLLSRWPILSKRYFPLPRVYVDREFNMQMGVLEGIVESPLGPLRIYNVHFGSVSAEERLQQGQFVLDLIRNAPARGGAWSGQNGEFSERDWCAGMPQPPMPKNAIVIGDFNLQPNSEAYHLLTSSQERSTPALLYDLWAQFNPGKSIMTWHSNPAKAGPAERAMLDYCLLSVEMLPMASDCWIDETAAGSDHQPLWASFESRSGKS